MHYLSVTLYLTVPDLHIIQTELRMFGLVASRWWLAHLPYNSHLGQLVDTSLPLGIIKQHNLWLLAEKVTASLLLPLDLCLSHLRADGIESIASAQYLYRRLLFCLCSIGRRWLFVLVVSALRSSTKLCTSSLGIVWNGGHLHLGV